MALKSFKAQKIFYSISEVSELFDVNEATLRYWEENFDIIKPKRSAKGTRQYRKEDIEAIRLVHYLVKEKGLTLAGAKKKLKENRDSVVNTEQIVFRLKLVREELLQLHEEFETLERITSQK